MYRIVTEETTVSDKAVTSFYLDTIYNAVIEAGKQCRISNGYDKIQKDETLIFDECKVALKYKIRGYKKTIVWIQGIVPEEAIMKGYSSLRYYVHSIIEYLVLKNCKLVIFCSDEMKKHYERKYRMCFDENSFIMPCFNESNVDENAFQIEDKYNRESYVYIGGLQPWQCFEETIMVYKEIEKRKMESSFLYVYTGDIETAKAAIAKADIKNFTVEYKDKNSLGSCLNNIKYGFVLRKDTEVNRVATPTKLSNYISHGIIPIYSECLKSFNQYNKESNGPAIVCNVENIDAGIENILNASTRPIDFDRIKNWSTQTYKSYYGRSGYVSELSKLIKKL